MIRLIEESPDADGNTLIRGAIREIRGKETLTALPKSYQGMTNELMRRVQRIAKARKVRLRRIHIDGPREELAVDLDSGQTIHIELDRNAWIASRVVAGTVAVEADGAEIHREEFSGIGELDSLFSLALDRHAGAGN